MEEVRNDGEEEEEEMRERGRMRGRRKLGRSGKKKKRIGEEEIRGKRR